MFKSEIYKLFKYKAFWIILLLQIAVSVLITLIYTPGSLSEALTKLDVTASFFLVFIVNTIARVDFQEGTMKNIIGSGIKRSAVFRAKLFASIVSGLMLLAADGAITVVITFVKKPVINGEILPLVIAVALQILMIILYAMLFFSFSYLLYKGPWGMLLSLFSVLFSSGVFLIFDALLKLPFKLHQFTIDNIMTVAKGLTFNLETMIPVLVTSLLVLAFTLLIYALTAKREIK